MKNTEKILAALAAGVAIGLVTGVLFAPDKGSETRKKIKEKGKKFSDDMQDKLIRGKEKISSLKEHICESISDKTEVPA